MNLNISQKKQEKLLGRTEVHGKIEFAKEKTSSNDAVRDAIAKSLNVENKLVVVKHIYTNFGTNSADVIAYVYDNEKKYDETEVRHKRAKAKKEGEAEAAGAKK